LFVAQRIYRPETAGLDLRAGAKVKRLQTLKGGEQVRTGGYHTVVLEDDHVISLGKGMGDVLTQLMAARQRIRRITYLPTNVMRLGDDTRVGDLAGNAKRDQGRRVGMDDSPKIGPSLVNHLVKGIFAGRFVRAFNPPVGFQTHNVAWTEIPLVHRCGRDPQIAVLIKNRHVTT